MRPQVIRKRKLRKTSTVLAQETSSRFRVIKTYLLFIMSTNEKTASVVDTLAAAELITTGALNSQTSKSAEQRIKQASVDETSLVESGCGVQKTGTNEECIKNNIVKIPLSPKIYWVETEKLQLNPLSDNIYGSDVPATLLASIKENDIRSPLIVSKSTMKVLSGNTRLRVAQQLSKEKIPVLFVEANLTEEDEQNLPSLTAREVAFPASVSGRVD
jgi:hypothetical protein